VIQPTHSQPAGLTRADFVTATEWAYRRGGGWAVEPIPSDNGAAGLGVTAPDGEALTFQVERVAAGFAAFGAEGWDVLGVWPGLLEALEAAAQTVDLARGQDVANDP
jgi:hypothetical protein